MKLSMADGERENESELSGDAESVIVARENESESLHCVKRD